MKKVIFSLFYLSLFVFGLIKCNQDYYFKFYGTQVDGCNVGGVLKVNQCSQLCNYYFNVINSYDADHFIIIMYNDSVHAPIDQGYTAPCDKNELIDFDFFDCLPNVNENKVSLDNSTFYINCFNSSNFSYDNHSSNENNNTVYTSTDNNSLIDNSTLSSHDNDSLNKCICQSSYNGSSEILSLINYNNSLTLDKFGGCLNFGQYNIKIYWHLIFFYNNSDCTTENITGKCYHDCLFNSGCHINNITCYGFTHITIINNSTSNSTNENNHSSTDSNSNNFYNKDNSSSDNNNNNFNNTSNNNSPSNHKYDSSQNSLSSDSNINYNNTNFGQDIRIKMKNGYCYKIYKINRCYNYEQGCGFNLKFTIVNPNKNFESLEYIVKVYNDSLCRNVIEHTEFMCDVYDHQSQVVLNNTLFNIHSYLKHLNPTPTPTPTPPHNNNSNSIYKQFNNYLIIPIIILYNVYL